MSEYRWYVRRMWIGVEFSLADPSFPQQYAPYYQRELVGIIRRSGWVQQVGHFCHIYVSYMGKNRYCANAEARIFPFHSLTLDPGEAPKKLELVWLGWCADNSTPAFVNKHGVPMALTDAGHNTPNTRGISCEHWQEEWKNLAYRKKMWASGGLLRVEQEYDKLARKVKDRRIQDAENKRQFGGS